MFNKSIFLTFVNLKNCHLHFMQKYIFCFVLCFFGLDVSKTQSLHFENRYDYLHLQNPSYLTIHSQSTINIGWRNQWPSTTSYTSYHFGYIYTQDDVNSKLGVGLTYESQGPAIRESLLHFAYAYDIKTTKKTTITPAFAGLLKSKTIDYAALTFENPGTTITTNKATTIEPQFNVGVLVNYHNTHFLGLGTENIFAYFNKSNDYRSIQFDYLFRYTQQRGIYQLKIEPWINILINNRYQSATYGLKGSYAPFLLGLSITHDQELNLLNSGILLGTKGEKYQFIYLYNLNLSQNLVFHRGFNAHEVTFSVFLRYKSNRRKMKAIKCPTF